MSNHLENTIDSFAEAAKSQGGKGIKKYGKPLDPFDNYDWLQMAKEEQVDGFGYLEAEIVKRRHIVGRLRRLIGPSAMSRGTKDEVNALLDVLEGSK